MTQPVGKESKSPLPYYIMYVVGVGVLAYVYMSTVNVQRVDLDYSHLYGLLEEHSTRGDCKLHTRDASVPAESTSLLARRIFAQELEITWVLLDLQHDKQSAESHDFLKLMKKGIHDMSAQASKALQKQCYERVDYFMEIRSFSAVNETMVRQGLAEQGKGYVRTVLELNTPNLNSAHRPGSAHLPIVVLLLEPTDTPQKQEKEHIQLPVCAMYSDTDTFCAFDRRTTKKEKARDLLEAVLHRSLHVAQGPLSNMCTTLKELRGQHVCDEIVRNVKQLELLMKELDNLPLPYYLLTAWDDLVRQVKEGSLVEAYRRAMALCFNDALIAQLYIPVEQRLVVNIPLFFPVAFAMLSGFVVSVGSLMKRRKVEE